MTNEEDDHLVVFQIKNGFEVHQSAIRKKEKVENGVYWAVEM